MELERGWSWSGDGVGLTEICTAGVGELDAWMIKHLAVVSDYLCGFRAQGASVIVCIYGGSCAMVCLHCGCWAEGNFPWFNLDLYFYHALSEQARTKRVSRWHPRRPRTEQEWMDTSPYWACLCRQCALEVPQNNLPLFCRQGDHILHKYHPVAKMMQDKMKVRGWEVRGRFQ